MSAADLQPTRVGNGDPDPARRHSFFSKLRVRLLGLVLLAVLPMLGLVLYTAFEQRRVAVNAAVLSAQRIVAFAAAVQKQHIEASRQLLVTLAQLKDVRPDRPEEAGALFRSLIQAHAIYANIGAIDAQGYLFASAFPVTNRVYLGNRPYFQAVREAPKLALGEYQLGQVPGKATLEMAYPMREPSTGQFLGALIVELDLSWINQVAARAELPDGSSVTVLDRQGMVLVHYALGAAERDWPARSTAEITSPAHLRNSSADANGVYVGLDGVKRLWARTALSRTGGLADAHVVVAIPVHMAYIAANQMLAQNLVFLGIVGVVALGAAWTVSELFILRQVRGLVAAAQRMRRGDLAARSGVDYTPGEIGQLAQTFDQMAKTLERRVMELQQAETELKGLNEDLEQRVVQRTIELKRSNEDLEQFAYVASHDLQEPLRMIHSYLQLLRQRYQDKLDTTALEFVQFSLDGAKRMHQLIQDLLAYSRVGTQGKQLTVTESEDALAGALSNLRIAIEEAHAEITHDPLPPVRGDIVQLTQLFQNLIGNAVKFRGANAPGIHVGAQKNGSEWHFSVRDNGIGIAEQDFQRIFVVFQRLHNREQYPGTGIGLSVCKKIVERHGGRIWVDSKLGRGTTFHFTIPLLVDGVN